MFELNKDQKTVEGFGDEWERFDQADLTASERQELFDKYFKIFPWSMLGCDAQGFDMGCGSGRWAQLVAPRVGRLHCIDPSAAIHVARRNLAEQSNCDFYEAGVSDVDLPDESMDFGYSLGVLHHVPDTNQGIRDCVRKLKIGAPFLLYLYYALDNKPIWYRYMWRLSDFLRRLISASPHGFRYAISQAIAIFIYWPLARFAALMDRFGMSSEKLSTIPLSFYRHLSFYTMRTDALDRFGTRLEHRFTREQIDLMMQNAGLADIKFSDDSPYWCAVGIRKG